ncbi:TIGR02996 domain-containing protein [Gemmata sp. G18]|uniref:TIGR02996 domain-containing protein n=1 Tax=Gemmata palustris TaxID=2822762 RepID=A0ABS5BV58_9BACT|nr:TIGR02996 domain-containing protein [Gemmata palustris]MBP3957599.1 TIGR02996 domain-containing protein [Gemmata palustris]
MSESFQQNQEAPMSDEESFLAKVLENPADDTTRLVFADWLDERDDAESKLKAQFLRATVRFKTTGNTTDEIEARRKELQPLAAQLPTDWLAVVSRLKVEVCSSKERKHRSRAVQRLFTFVCDKNWDEMTPTEDPTVRQCEQCHQAVHYCDTITTAREHADQDHCIAIDLGIIRRESDLEPRRDWLGRVSAEMLREEEERCQVDAVSQEREGRKRQQSGTASANG